MDDPDLHRQRRNVMATSIVLLIFDLADARIGEVSVLGTKLLIGNPQVLAVGAWVMWGYFLLRYYQFWRESPGFNKLIEEAAARRHSYFASWMKRRAKQLTNKRTTEQNHGSLRSVHYKIFAYDDPPHLGGPKLRQTKVAELEEGVIPAPVVVAYQTRALVAASFQTTQFTEQVLPFFVGLAPPVMALGEWVQWVGRS